MSKTIVKISIRETIQQTAPPAPPASKNPGDYRQKTPAKIACPACEKSGLIKSDFTGFVRVCALCRGRGFRKYILIGLFNEFSLFERFKMGLSRLLRNQSYDIRGSVKH